ncbi:MAG: complex I NDUFA9 subunit family protein [Chromatiales bacterium]|nr:complex I NDUFA9 subunit family protein [Chromatiales bacterium]
MQICVLGGSGFVGSRLVARLANAGHAIVVPTRIAARAAHLRLMPTVTTPIADIHDPATLNRLTSGCDVVVNLVGILNEKGRKGDGFHHAHAALAGKLVAALEGSTGIKLVQMSALKAGADGPSYYLKSKGEAERLIRKATGLRWTILRPSVIFGPGDSFVNRFAGLIALLPGVFPLAMPGARFAPVHVDDVVAALGRAVLDSATDGQVYELGGPETFTLGEIVRQIASTMSRRVLVIGLPQKLSRLQAAVMDFVPGKPFSTDNYRSLLVESVPAEDGFARLGIQPAAFTTLLPASLDRLRARTVLDEYRRDRREAAR